ncbi:short neuropeptide F precursor [Cochliomyia hominivorax]
MHFPSQLIYKLTLGTFLMLWAQSSADLLEDAASLNNLYNDLLQREYAGPVVFPNHQVERKAQRSPSLRLRFGRSDPDLLPHVPAKRWFGDVDQKPIRSPSRRLRFGRSDPSMPIHSAFDILMNAQQDAENNIENSENEDNLNRVARVAPRLRWGRSLPWEETNKDDSLSRVARVAPRLRWGRSIPWGEDNNDDSLNRVARQPPRLRWGRSLPFQSLNSAPENELVENVAENDVEDDDDDVTLSNTEDDFNNSLMQSLRLGNLLRSLQKYSATTGSSPAYDIDMNEFERAIRKPGPLRLRWGRSTGGKTSVGEKEQKNNLEEKNKPTEISNEVDKSLNQKKD